MMGTEYIGWAIKRVSFYPDRGRVQEWFDGDGRWIEASGYTKGLTMKPCPPGAKIYGAPPYEIAASVDGHVFGVCRYVEEAPGQAARGRF